MRDIEAVLVVSYWRSHADGNMEQGAPPKFRRLVQALSIPIV